MKIVRVRPTRHGRFKLGDSVDDPITGFSGTVTGVAEYINGRQYLVEPRVDEAGRFVSAVWFVQERLVIAPSGK